MQVRTLAASVLFVSSLTTSQADVIVVDAAGGPGSDFTSLQDAVLAALDGDTLLVRDGNYRGGLTIDAGARSLTLVADAGAEPAVTSVAISNVAAGKEVVLRGIDMSGGLFSYGLNVFENDGRIWVEDAVIGGSTVFGGISATNTNSIVIARCSVSQAAPSGIRVEDASASIYDTDVAAASGGDALYVRNGSVHVSGGTFTGGSGADAIPPFCIPATAGGDGLFVVGASTVDLLGATFVAGTGGSVGACGGNDGADGQDINVVSGVVSTSIETARSYVFDAPVRAGQSTQVRFQGQHGELALAYFSSSSLTPLSPGFAEGWLTLAPPSRRFLVTAIGPDDTSTENVVIGSIGGLDQVKVFTQAIYFTGGSFIYSAPSSVLVLDPSF